MTKRAIICDIDGTVATHGNERGHHEYEKVGGDRPNQTIIDLVHILSQGYWIVFVSGRMEHCREITEDWLETHMGSWTRHCELFMRPDGDHRQDTIVKREIHDRDLVPKYDIVCAIDDRNQVVKMWRDMGITCLQVAEGNF
jgi:hydroxymethylpyrimidine pyrophosphatase-like HAD family hydrolase